MPCTAAARYHASNAVNQLSIEEGLNSRRAKAIVLKDFYVDDVLTGVKNSKKVLNC